MADQDEVQKQMHKQEKNLTTKRENKQVGDAKEARLLAERKSADARNTSADQAQQQQQREVQIAEVTDKAAALKLDEACKAEDLPGGFTTVQHLVKALCVRKTEFKGVPGFDPNIDDKAYYRQQQMIDCDEVYPQIYIGNGLTAKKKDYLKRIEVTHVLNAAEGKTYGFVRTNAEFYRDTPIKYLGIHVYDSSGSDIMKFFDEAAEFIEDAVSSGGRVFVHCHQGISRSSTLVIAYLMIKKKMLAADAIRTIKQCRAIQPNDGFLHQLAMFDNHLRKQRL